MMGGMNALGQAAGPAGPAISGGPNSNRVSIGAPVFQMPGTTSSAMGAFAQQLPLLAVAAVVGIYLYKNG